MVCLGCRNDGGKVGSICLVEGSVMVWVLLVWWRAILGLVWGEVEVGAVWQEVDVEARGEISLCTGATSAM